MRLFIAIDVSDEVRSSVMIMMKELEKMWGGVRWVKPDGIHLTLKFLGEVEEANVGSIVKALKGICPQHRPFHAEMESLGRFPEKGKPRVAWLGVKDETGSLKRLAEDIEKEMEQLGFEREVRGFKPHITLGRVKVPGREERGLKFLDDHSQTRFGSYEVDRFHLIKSTLLPDGARYEKLESFILG